MPANPCLYMNIATQKFPSMIIWPEGNFTITKLNLKNKSLRANELSCLLTSDVLCLRLNTDQNNHWGRLGSGWEIGYSKHQWMRLHVGWGEPWDGESRLRCQPCQISPNHPGPWFNIKTSAYQHMKSHCGDKTVVRSSYLHNGISYIQSGTKPNLVAKILATNFGNLWA